MAIQDARGLRIGLPVTLTEAQQEQARENIGAARAIDVNPKDYGVKGDAVTTAADGTASITSGTAVLTMTGTNFQTTDIGKLIQVPGAGTAGATLYTTIAGRTSTTVITLADNAATTLSSAATSVIYGTDDTEALQASLDALAALTKVAGPETYNGIQGAYSGSYPTWAVPSGRYMTGTLDIPAYFRAEGRNNAVFIGTDPDEDIFDCPDNYQFFTDGIGWVGGRHHVYLRNANIDKTMWKIRRFTSRMSSSYAFKTEATGGVWTHLSANLTLEDGIEENNNKFLDNACDSCIASDVWSQPNRSNFEAGSAHIRNRGTTGHPKLSLHNFFGIPVMGTAVEQSTTTTDESTAATLSEANVNIVVGMRVTGTGIAADTTVAAIDGTSLTLSQAATASGTVDLIFNNRPEGCRWIDNYGSVFADQRTRFGGEYAGMAIVSHLVAPNTVYPWDPYQIVLDCADINAGPAILADSGVVSLQGEMPNLISIRNSIGAGVPLIVNIGSAIDASYFTDWETASGQSAFDFFKVDLGNNHTVANGGAIYSALLPAVIRPYLTGRRSAILRRAATQALANGLANRNIAFDTVEFNSFIPNGDVPPNETTIEALPMPASCTRMRISVGVTLSGSGVADFRIVKLRLTDSSGNVLPGAQAGGPMLSTADGYYLQVSTEVTGSQGDTFRAAIAHNSDSDLSLLDARVVLEPMDAIE